MRKRNVFVCRDEKENARLSEKKLMTKFSREMCVWANEIRQRKRKLDVASLTLILSLLSAIDDIVSDANRNINQLVLFRIQFPSEKSRIVSLCDEPVGS